MFLLTDFFFYILNLKNINVMDEISKYMNEMCTVFLLVSRQCKMLG